MNPLKSRLSRLEKLVQEREEERTRKETLTTAQGFKPGFPTRDKWPQFAAKTWIRTSGTVKPFIPFQVQEELIQSIEDHQYTIILKSRQVGASETVCSYLLCRALTEPGFAAVVFSKTAQDSGALGKRIRAQAVSIDDASIRFTTESNSELSFEGLGTIYFLPATPRAARGIPSVSVVVLDEAAFLEGASEIYTAALPTMSTLGEKSKLILLSTPNGLGNLFADLWHGDSDDQWNRASIHYSQIPIYADDPDWAEKTQKKAKLTDRAWRQEFEMDFVASDAQVFAPELIDKACKGNLIECGLINRDYIIGVDPAAGGDDYFCAVVLDVTQPPYRAVGMFRTRYKSSDYCIQQIIELCENFVPRQVIIEKNGVGAVVSEILSKALSKYQTVPYNTNRPNKISNTDRIVYYLEREELILPVEPFRNEMMCFRQNSNGDRCAAEGQHDDSVMALALGLSALADTPSSAWLDMV